ncbi:hypothetical protein [Salmonella enterica]|uniref:Uncharacterized protein n=1 Tax=Salmonella phage vB_Se_STGO-35-1 TaxID=2749381 RepID=A0A889INL2_9CAUD|nr:hypothetical protein [Salmonella enterica]YP_010054044.1 hypothetical protein KGB48_gp24 [Salmonella phage vB_Se_STGO-35-1]QRD99759.1 hypothetical protein JKL37_0023 [Salmonella phage vB_Se_STGO-35-1]
MTLRYKLLMGGVDDFDGAHHEDTHAFVHNKNGWVTFTNDPKTINKDLFTLLAHREPIASEQDLNDCIGAPEADNKYLHEIKPGVFVDVYDVLMAWSVTNPALQHLIKKALQAGDRGHKSREQDLQDIIDSAIRAKELEIK